MIEHGPQPPRGSSQLESHQAMWPITVLRGGPFVEYPQTFLVLDNDLIGGAVIASARLRAIAGIIEGLELVLVRFNTDRSGAGS